MKNLCLILLLVSLTLAQERLAADSYGGQVVWWAAYPGALIGNRGSNGVVSCPGEVLTNVVALAARGSGALLLRHDGEVFGWRTHWEGRCRALKSDGTAVAWWVRTSQREALPPGLRGLAALAGGGDAGLALRRDSTVVMWGGFTDVPSGLSNVVAIAAGEDFCLAITTNANWTPSKK